MRVARLRHSPDHLSVRSKLRAGPITRLKSRVYCIRKQTLPAQRLPEVEQTKRGSKSDSRMSSATDIGSATVSVLRQPPEG